jgi:hypothetical protein
LLSTAGLPTGEESRGAVSVFAGVGVIKGNLFRADHIVDKPSYLSHPNYAKSWLFVLSRRSRFSAFTVALV